MENAVSIDRPRLRNVEIFPVQSNGRRFLCLRDPQGISPQPLIVSEHAGLLLSYMDGNHSVAEIQAAFVRRFGQLIFSDRIVELINLLDESLLLDSPRFRAHYEKVQEEFLQATVRKPSHAGVSYPEEPEELLAKIDSYFLHPEGPGTGLAPDVPETRQTKGSIAAVVAPHIDFERGGPTYAWAYHTLAQTAPPDLFIILGINHYQANHLYTLTAKDFETPLGIMRTSRESVNFLRQRCGDWIVEEEMAHRGEHSVEFQVVFLQHWLARVREAYPDRHPQIVPVLCSAFHHLLKPGESVESLVEFASFTGALRDLITQHDGNVCLIASVDFSHVGPRFGDPAPLSPSQLRVLEIQDRSLLARVAELDLEGFLEAIRENSDRTRIDAVPAICTMLRSLVLEKGNLLKYAQAVDPAGQSCVSFASMFFQ